LKYFDAQIGKLAVIISRAIFKHCSSLYKGFSSLIEFLINSIIVISSIAISCVFVVEKLLQMEGAPPDKYFTPELKTCAIIVEGMAKVP
jgi:hypothetical protein